MTKHHNTPKRIIAARAYEGRRKSEAAHFVIDGEPFETANLAYGVAQSKGVTVSLSAFRGRLMRGEITWADLLRPPENAGYSGAQMAARLRKKNEMAAICAAIDSRKKEISGD